MNAKDKKTTNIITIRFNITESEIDNEMRAILSSLHTSQRVDFIKECVMTQSRRILRNEFESLKVDALTLKEEYIKNNVNVAGVTFKTKEEHTDLLIDKIEELIGLNNPTNLESSNTVVNTQDSEPADSNIYDSEQDEFDDEYLDDDEGCPPSDSLDDDEY